MACGRKKKEDQPAKEKEKEEEEERGGRGGRRDEEEKGSHREECTNGGYSCGGRGRRKEDGAISCANGLSGTGRRVWMHHAAHTITSTRHPGRAEGERADGDGGRDEGCEDESEGEVHNAAGSRESADTDSSEGIQVRSHQS